MGDRVTNNRRDRHPAVGRVSALRLMEPELAFVRTGDGPDPRLIEMVHLLARRAACEVYEEQQEERRRPRS